MLHAPGGFLTPDRIWRGLQRRPRPAVGLHLLATVETTGSARNRARIQGGGTLAYKFSERGYARFMYFRSRGI
jgi:hypothetical protein